jgi:hypothetical protein
MLFDQAKLKEWFDLSPTSSFYREREVVSQTLSFSLFLSLSLPKPLLCSSAELKVLLKES